MVQWITWKKKINLFNLNSFHKLFVNNKLKDFFFTIELKEIRPSIISKLLRLEIFIANN